MKTVYFLKQGKFYFKDERGENVILTANKSDAEYYIDKDSAQNAREHFYSLGLKFRIETN